MADVIPLKTKGDYPVILKEVDGKVIELVDIDSLTEDQFKKFCRDTATEWFQRRAICRRARLLRRDHTGD